MKIKCPACSEILEVPDTAAGNVVKCPCGKQLRVPAAVAPPTPPARPTSAAPPTPDSHLASANDDLFGDFDSNQQQPVQQSQNPYAQQTLDSQSPDPLQGYAPPTSAGYAGTTGPGALVFGVRASLGQRIGGALIDAFLAFGLGIAFAVGGGIVGAIIAPQDEDVMIGLGYAAFYVGLFSTFLLNAVLITLSGQSVGKKVVGSRIVNRSTGTQSGFLQGVLLRNFVFGIITSIPCIGSIIGLVDLIMLFPEPNETLHDKLAGTAVVQA